MTGQMQRGQSRLVIIPDQRSGFTDDLISREAFYAASLIGILKTHRHHAHNEAAANPTDTSTLLRPTGPGRCFPPLDFARKVRSSWCRGGLYERRNRDGTSLR